MVHDRPVRDARPRDDQARDAKALLARAISDERGLTRVGRTSWGVCVAATLGAFALPPAGAVLLGPVALVAAVGGVVAGNRRERLRGRAGRPRKQVAASATLDG